jgi:hypothetical protein
MCLESPEPGRRATPVKNDQVRALNFGDMSHDMTYWPYLYVHWASAPRNELI